MPTDFPRGSPVLTARQTRRLGHAHPFFGGKAVHASAGRRAARLRRRGGKIRGHRAGEHFGRISARRRRPSAPRLPHRRRFFRRAARLRRRVPLRLRRGRIRALCPARHVDARAGAEAFRRRADDCIFGGKTAALPRGKRRVRAVRPARGGRLRARRADDRRRAFLFRPLHARRKADPLPV